MFTEYFYTLRKHKVPVSLTEWMALMQYMAEGHIKNLDEFYLVARAILVKSESFYDNYDVAFHEYFKGVETLPEVSDEIWEWLRNPVNRRLFDEEELSRMQKLDLEQLLKQLEERLRQQTEQHDGGNRWIGRGGISPFGHSGINPAGIRIGGESGGRHAVKIAGERRFRNYRSDLTLDVRQMKMALRRLRHFNRIGPEDELDLEQTIDATCRNSGELELKWRRHRKNTVKLLLLMDVGGSMDPFALLCSQLFSAAKSSSHFKDLQYYYFHNCIYDKLYRDMDRRDAISTEYLLHTLEPGYKVLLVGDASMSPYELTDRYGAIDYYEQNETPGLVWLRRFSEHFTHTVWLNPESERYWQHTTVMAIGKLFPMYQLTLEGLSQAVKRLVVRR